MRRSYYSIDTKPSLIAIVNGNPSQDTRKRYAQIVETWRDYKADLKAHPVINAIFYGGILTLIGICGYLLAVELTNGSLI